MSLGKKDICSDISSKAQISKDISKHFFEKFIYIVSTNSKKRIVKITNFGTFYFKNSPERLGRNPKTKEKFIISKRKKLFFKTSSKIKKIIN